MTISEERLEELENEIHSPHGGHGASDDEMLSLISALAERDALTAKVDQLEKVETASIKVLRDQKIELKAERDQFAAHNAALRAVVEAWFEAPAHVDAKMEGAQPVYSATALRRCWALTCEALSTTPEASLTTLRKEIEREVVQDITGADAVTDLDDTVAPLNARIAELEAALMSATYTLEHYDPETATKYAIPSYKRTLNAPTPTITLADRDKRIRREALERAKRELQSRYDDILKEEGHYDPTTNVTELPEEAETRLDEIDSCMSEIRNLIEQETGE